MPRKPCPEFLYYSKRSLIPKRAAFIFVTCCKLEFIHLYPATTTPAKSRVFGGAFYLSPKLLIPIFFWDSAGREGARFVRQLGMGPPPIPRFWGGGPRLGSPPLSPLSPPRGSLLCPRCGAAAKQWAGRVGVGKKGGKNGEKSGEKRGRTEPEQARRS